MHLSVVVQFNGYENEDKVVFCMRLYTVEKSSVKCSLNKERNTLKYKCI